MSEAATTWQPNDEVLRAALETASCPALLMSLVQLSGDASRLEGSIRPHPPAMLELQGHLDEAEQAEIRERAFEQLRDLRDRGWPEAPAPDEATTRRMLAFALGEAELDEPYATMLLEELALDGKDRRRLEIDAEALARLDPAFRVLIVGAGMSGLALAVRLEQAGVPYTIVEKNEDFGGTWFENRYPGCRVDIASHAYSYSFAPGHGWRHYFGQHEELRDYFREVADRYAVRPHCRFRTQVERARWDERAGHWWVEVEHEGERETLRADVVASAVGQLNQPKIPDVPGRTRFRGPQMHTAQWDDSVELAGKRVAVVGSGATAFQMVPELAKVASALTVFQRTPQWMFPNPGYHAEVPEAHTKLMAHLPGYERWFRILSLWPMTDKAQPQVLVDPAWEDGGRSCGEANRAMREGLEAWIRSQVRDDALLEKVIPSYPPFGTRTLQDNGSWLGALQQEHVELVAEGVARVTETGLVSERGVEVEADVIVWATGFHAHHFLWPMGVEGRDGKRLAEEWKDVPKAYLGIAMPGFPNLFCLYGPNTNVAHTVNVIFVSECQTRYIGDAVKRLIEGGGGAFDCKQEVADAYEARLSEALDGMVWSYPGVHSFYRAGGRGRVVVNMPWQAKDYWRWTRSFDPSDYERLGGDGR